MEIRSRGIRIAIHSALIVLLPIPVYWIVVGGGSDCDFFTLLKGVGKRAVSIGTPRHSWIRKVGTDGDTQLWDTSLGRFWIPVSTTEPQLRTIVHEQEADIYSAATTIHPGDVVLDCGADVGTFARIAIRHGASRLIAVEPAPWKIPCLRRTFATEIAQGRVTIYAKGVWHSEAELLLDKDTISDRGHKVPLTTIDHIVEELRLDRLDLVKMDIEGAEKQALLGARNTILRFKPRFTIATEHFPDDHSAIPALLRGIVPGYTTNCGPCVRQFGRLQPYTMQFTAQP